MDRQKIQSACVGIAWALWRGMSADYKRRYARVIWDQFQGRLAGEAQTTSNLGQYVNSLCSKLQVVQLPKESIEELDEIFESNNDRAILRMMREETALIVVKIRVMNEERKAQFEDEYAEEEALIEALDGKGGLFDGISE